MGTPIALVQGTLDLLILKAISLEPKHGAIAERIEQISKEVLQVQQGSLYPRCIASNKNLDQSQNGQKRNREEKRNSTR